MFDNQPTNPQIVQNILELSDSWKELLGPDEKPKKKRAPSKKSKAKS